MNKLNVVLLKLPTLYEILTEIKLDLNFNLINFSENNSDFQNFLIEKLIKTNVYFLYDI